jgi:hypothetical protein
MFPYRSVDVIKLDINCFTVIYDNSLYTIYVPWSSNLISWDCFNIHFIWQCLITVQNSNNLQDFIKYKTHNVWLI